MSGVEFTMLAHGFSGADVALMLLFIFGPGVLAFVGLFLSFFPRRKWLALAAVVASLAWPMLFLGSMEIGFWMEELLERIFLKWDVDSVLIKLPFILGPITIAHVYYLHRKQAAKNPPQEMNESDGRT